MSSTRVHGLLIIAFGACGTSTAAFADNPLGFYLGAGAGESNVRTNNEVAEVGKDYKFDEQHGAWKVTAGIRPLSPLGVELEYIDFGNPSTGYSADSSVGYTLAGANADARAGMVFGLGYLPLPVPFLDVYGKAGLARLHTTSTEVPVLPFDCPVGLVPCFPRGTIFHQSAWSTNFAYGAGVQVKIGSLAVRAEYERISASGSDPDIASLGVTWTF
jgi:opacity protein-like surface antigen